MRPRRLLMVAAIVAVASLSGATVAAAHTLVDPTTLTPPLPGGTHHGLASFTDEATVRLRAPLTP